MAQQDPVAQAELRRRGFPDECVGKVLLDHGYIALIETWGSDERIIESARMSTNKGFQGWGPVHESTCRRNEPKPPGPPNPPGTCCKTQPGDEKLLRYLYENKHESPFEFAGMVIEVQAPIFVFREWHRHRTQSYNEMSARYTPLPDFNYVPTVERLLLNAGTNKQTQGTGNAIDRAAAEAFTESIADQYMQCELAYQRALSAGAPKELARLVLPVGRYSKMLVRTSVTGLLS